MSVSHKMFAHKCNECVSMSAPELTMNNHMFYPRWRVLARVKQGSGPDREGSVGVWSMSGAGKTNSV